MSRLGLLHLSFGLTLLLGCARAPGVEEAPDAGSSALATSGDARTEARAVVDLVLAQPPLAQRPFARLGRAKALRPSGAGFEVDSATVQAALPARAASSTRLSAGPAWLELTPQALADRTAEPAGSVLVYRDAATATDLLVAAVEEGIEEVRVLRAPSAPSVFRWTARTAPKTTLRVREGIAELVDEGQRVVLASARPFAVDARGVRRDLDWSLEGDTLRARLDPEGLAYPIVVDPLWSAIAPFVVPNRVAYAVTRLTSGKVLAAAGQLTTGGPIASAEVYDPATNTWSSAGNVAYPRTGGFAVPITAGALAGRVFLAGGSIPGSEVYDPATGTSVGGPAPGVTVLSMASAGARVLVFNGTSAISWDSATNLWSATANLPTGRTTAANWTLTSLADGRVVIAGGHSIGPESSSAVDLYRPTTNDFVVGAPMPFNAEGHSAALLAGGAKVLVSGGTSVGIKTTTINGGGAVYDSATNTWSGGVGMISARTGHGSALLPNGKVVVAGGGTTGVELFDPALNTFQVAGNAPTGAPGVTTAAVSTGALFFPSKLLFGQGALGAACIIGYECLTGNCVQGVCCGSASCSGGARCDTATKAGTCTKPNGVACAGGTECESGLCVDKVCCNAACGGQCQACDVPGKAGTCSPVYGAPHGARTACAGTGGADVCQQQICNGVDATACSFAPAYTVVCGANTCSAGKETHTGTCDGKGVCSDVPRGCGVYTCGATTCRTSCSDSTQCVAGFYCDTSKSACVPAIGLGNKCSATAPCTPGLSCTDGVCCGVADCGPGASCAAPGKEGKCTSKQGSACALDSDCGSSNCVDGVCCDSRCSGQCEACDAAGSVGTCTPTPGKPHGARPACPSDPGNACADLACDGADRTRCAAYPGSDVVCRSQSCKGGLLTTKALCDGKGNCPEKSTASCGGYRCDEAANACKTTCAAATDCATGWSCEAGACTKNTSFCSIDGLSLVDATGGETSCKPYRCKDARCQASCATTDDCTAGTLCATDSKTCVLPQPPAAEDDGGGCATGRRGPSGVVLAFAALLAACALRRRAPARR